MSKVPYAPNALLLKDVLTLPTQPRVQAYVKAALDAMKRPYVEDAAGNIVSDPTPDTVKPWFVGHMDTVHREHNDDTELVVLDNGGWLTAFWTGAKKNEPYKQTGIGGDDKVGVWACLEACIRENMGGPAVGVAFVTDEEIGCVGSKALLNKHTDWFKNGSCFLQLDRRGDGDAINSTNGIDIWTKEFEALIAPVMTEFKFKPCGGSLTDIGEFARFCKKPAMNISSGYHNAHMSTEYVHSGQAIHSLHFAYAVADACVAAGNATGTLEVKDKWKSYTDSYLGKGESEGDWWGDGAGGNRRGRWARDTEASIKTRLAYICRRASTILGVAHEMVTATVSPDGTAVYHHVVNRRWLTPTPGNTTPEGYAKNHAELLLDGWRVETTKDRLATFHYDDYVVWRLLAECAEGLSWAMGSEVGNLFKPHLKLPKLEVCKARSDEATTLAGYPVVALRVENALMGRDGKTVVYPTKYEARLKDLEKDAYFSDFCISNRTLLFFTGTKDGKSYCHAASDAKLGVKKLDNTFAGILKSKDAEVPKEAPNPNVPFVG
jgi:hypothetical protein